MTTRPLVTVIVPTHSHDETLGYSVRSILEQTVDDLRVVVIGDGATDAVRDVARELCRSDERVLFEDHPKSPRRGELHRDRVIRELPSTYVAYNCDDDLWFPDHLQTMLDGIGDHHFIHPLAILIAADGRPFFLPSDLSRPDSLEWHLGEFPRNTISLSGVMHTREAYLRLPHGWRETPEGRWTDHYMWEQFFRQEWFSGVTSPRATTLKLRATGRDDRPAGARRSEIEQWWSRMHDPGFGPEWDEMVLRAVRKAALDNLLAVTERDHRIGDLQRESAHTRAELQLLAETQQQLEARVANLRGQLRAMRTSRSWRLTRPLRGLSRFRNQRR